MFLSLAPHSIFGSLGWVGNRQLLNTLSNLLSSEIFRRSGLSFKALYDLLSGEICFHDWLPKVIAAYILGH